MVPQHHNATSTTYLPMIVRDRIGASHEEADNDSEQNEG